MKKKIFIPFLSALACACFVSSFAVKTTAAETTGAETDVFYELQTQTLVENYASQGLYQSEKSGNGYVFKSGNLLVSPAATGGMAVTFTAPCDATVKPVNGNSVAAYRTHQVLDEHADDGVRMCVFLNDEKIYPAGADLFTEIGDDVDNPTRFALPELSLNAGDKLRFIVDCGGAGNNAWDSVYFNAEGMYTDENVTAETYVSFSQVLSYADSTEAASASGLGEYTKGQLISYEYVDIKERVPMEEVPENTTRVAVVSDPLVWATVNDTYFWCGAKTDVYLYYDHAQGGEFMTPGNFSSIALAFTAPCDGKISNRLGLGAAVRKTPIEEGADGARLTVVKEDKVLFPSEGIWATLPSGDETPMDIKFNSFDIKKGETLYYIVDCGGDANNNYDNVRFDNWGFVWMDENNPDGVWFGISDNFYTGETGDEESAIAGVKKADVLSYLYTSVEDPIPNATEITTKTVEAFDRKLFAEMDWNKKGDKLQISGDRDLLVNELYAQPSLKNRLAIEWTAPADGRVDVSKSCLWNANFAADVPSSNGVQVKLLLNDVTQIFPSDRDWAHTKNTEKMYFDVGVFEVKKGDTLLFVADCDGEVDYDTLDLTLVYDFAVDGDALTNRYNNKVYLTEEETPFAYYGIEIPVATSDRYFGGNQTELSELTMSLAGGCGGSVGGLYGALSALGISGCALAIRKKKKGKKQ